MLAAVAAIEPIIKLHYIYALQLAAFEPIIYYIIHINSSRTIRKHRPRPHGPILLIGGTNGVHLFSVVTTTWSNLYSQSYRFKLQIHQSMLMFVSLLFVNVIVKF